MSGQLNNSLQTVELASDTQQVFCKTPKLYRNHKDRIGDSEYSAWFRAQARVRSWLRTHKIHTKAAGYFDPFDLKTDNGIRIEVKASGMGNRGYGKKPHWIFNIHRHGVLNEKAVDVYILRCEIPASWRPIFGGSAIHLVLPAPVGVKSIAISPRALMTRWAHAFNNVEQITRGSL